MIKLISKKIADYLCVSENNMESYELYEYAVYIVLSAVFHILTTIVIGVCFNLAFESVLFYLSFIAIRKFAGGYHSKTPAMCYVFSIIMTVSVLILLKVLVMYNNLYLQIFTFMCGILSVIVIIILSPLDNENNLLGDKEKHIYKIISIINTCVLFIIASVIIIFDLLSIGLSIYFGILISALVLIMRKIQASFEQS